MTVAQPGEQSVGDILESIKKVMERDDRGVGGPSLPRGEPLATSGDDGEPAPVLELTDAHMAPVLADESGLVSERREAAPPAAREAAPSAEPVPAGDAARASLRELLSALAVLADPAASPPAPRPGETSLEGLARDLMRPMIAEWLDANLPPLAERLVAAEIARIRDRPA